MLHKKQSKAKKLIVPAFIAAIMIFSILGYALIYNSGDSSNIEGESYDYNGYRYTVTQQGWVAQIGDNQALFTYGPRQLEDIILPDFDFGDKVYLAYDPDNKDQNIDFILQKLNSILNFVNIRTVTSCIKDSLNCPDIPVVDCNSEKKVIAVLNSEELGVNKEGNCLYIQGKSSDLNKISDKIAMRLLGLL